MTQGEILLPGKLIQPPQPWVFANNVAQGVALAVDLHWRNRRWRKSFGVSVVSYPQRHPGLERLDGVVFPDAPGYHHIFRLVDREQNTTLTEDLVTHFFELPKFRLSAEQLTTPLEGWLYFLRYADRLDPAELPGALDTEEIRQAMEGLMLLTQVDIQKEICEGRLKARRDALWIQNEMARKDEALARKDEALAEALDRGVLMGQVGLLQKLLRRNGTPREELEAMPLPAREALVAQLERELPG